MGRGLEMKTLSGASFMPVQETLSRALHSSLPSQPVISRPSSFDVLVLGSANLVADGISMGFSDFVSSSIERDMAARARLATERKITNHDQPQQMELLHTYQALGMEPEDARTTRFTKKTFSLLFFLVVFSRLGKPPHSVESRPVAGFSVSSFEEDHCGRKLGK
ncbi:hypothetical protein MRB53_019786 [Persea americana]|uniref:Uncharacterized protein n=1 Tax=Persea americana TaxID=3435 RepID=A0ACC2KZ50_PERAE|nr:hypothetical protein MRB53_019786 [Persea americana]